jgi:hypothetical protein
MQDSTIYLDADSDFCKMLVDRLGLIKHHASIIDGVMEFLEANNTNEELESDSLLYDEILVCDEAGFEMSIDSLDEDTPTLEFWMRKVPTASIDVVYSGMGRLDCEWKIQVDVSTNDIPLLVQFEIEISKYKRISNVCVSTLPNQNYNHPEWTAFLLRYQ